ncbi:MAG: RsiV family protein [Bacteroidales bacterium]|nr:RsiV family protein [Bacteroidales bacterium]
MKNRKQRVFPAALRGKAIWALAGAFAVASTGCKSPTGNAQDSTTAANALATQTILYELNDSVPRKDDKAAYIHFSAKADVDWPTNDNDKAAAAVRSHIAATLLNAAQPASDGEQTVRQALDTLFSKMRTEALATGAPGMERYFSYKKVCENGTYVSFEEKNYYYDGGANGNEQASGDTYSKADGKRFGFDLLKADAANNKALKRLLLDALQKKFGAANDAELAKAIGDFVPVNEDQFPLPKQHPYFQKDGVTFVYQPYEIASHAAGTPLVVIPFEKMKPFLSDEALNLLGE